METPAVLQMSIDKYKTLRNKTVGKLLMIAVMTPLWKCSLALTAGKKLGLDSDHKALLFLHLCSVLTDTVLIFAIMLITFITTITHSGYVMIGKMSDTPTLLTHTMYRATFTAKTCVITLLYPVKTLPLSLQLKYHIAIYNTASN